MAMVGMPLIILMINSFSYVGAGIATVIIEAGIFTITYFTVKKVAAYCVRSHR
jgi:O-antigen/teichoic acid export membrane protein